MVNPPKCEQEHVPIWRPILKPNRFQLQIF